MTYSDIKRMCGTRSAIYRMSNPKRLYWSDNVGTFDMRVSHEDRAAGDWQVYDPRENPEGMAYGEQPA